METEQWKQAKELKMKYFVSEPVDTFLHFDKADFSRWGTTVRDLVKIKETAQQSPTFNVFSMALAGFEEEEEMIDTFGDEYAEDDDSLAWFFRTPNPDKALVLFYYREQQMIKIATLAMKTVTDSNLSLSD
uniref:FTH domain-containing protein n=1 Tax=Caenorhabditis tropicalis TaxID=1561998 RepID=A0A1I7UIC7_9PELO